MTSSIAFSIAPVSVICLQALRLDDGVGVLAFGPHGLEHFLGDLAGDGVVGDARQQPGEARRVDAAIAPISRLSLVQRRGELAHHPVGGELGVLAGTCRQRPAS